VNDDWHSADLRAKVRAGRCWRWPQC